jgi:hypothetical protein
VIVTNGAVIIESAGEITTISVFGLSSEVISSSFEQEVTAVLTAIAAHNVIYKCGFVIIL